MAFRKLSFPVLGGVLLCGLIATLALTGCSLFGPVEQPKLMSASGKPDLSKLKKGMYCRIETPREVNNNQVTFRYFEGTVDAVTENGVTLKNATVGTYPERETSLLEDLRNPRNFLQGIFKVEGETRDEVFVSAAEIGTLGRG